MPRSSNKNLSLEWTKGLDGKQKEDMELTVRHSTIVLSRMLQIIDDKLDTLERKEVDPQTYENPAFAYEQAHINGRRGELLSLRRLLSFIEG